MRVTWKNNYSIMWLFAYLKKYNHSSMVFDWTYLELDESVFQECDWSEFYPDAKEAIPPNMLEPRGKHVVAA
jgi:hypothetical protein